MDFSATQSSKVSFWRRHTAKLPGSVKPVPGRMGVTGNMVFGAQYSHATSVLEVERLRALQMDPASWANDHPTIADDSNYDDHPELSGYQTLPEQDLKDDSEVESPSPESDKKNRMSLQSASGKLVSMGSGDNDKKDVTSEQGAKNDTIGSGSPVVVEGMKPNALSILQDPLLILRGLDYEAAMGDLHLVGTDHKSDEGLYALQRSKQKARFHKFKEMLQQPVVDLDVLRKLSWS
ncbi:hypothetical protein BGZ92_001656, partial [Podila epicladia]